jgi:DNA-binding response OmpR family regulator
MDKQSQHIETEATILVVDDEKDLLEGVRLTLERADYTVLAVSNGFDGLEVLAKQPVDLILSDIAMPIMNGYQFYERVMANPDWVKIPFIFLSARGMNSDIRYGKELGVDDYLIKPFRTADLLAVVRGCLRRAHRVAQATRASTGTPTADASKLVHGRLEVYCDQHKVVLDGQPIQLSLREFKLLEYLSQRPNQVIPLQELIRVTHDLETDYTDASSLLRPLVRSLRRKLGYGPGEMGCILSKRGVGYLLVPPLDPGLPHQESSAQGSI